MASGIGLGRRDRRRGPPQGVDTRGYDYTQAPADLARMFGRAGRSGIEGYETALTGRTPEGHRVGNVLPLAMDEQTGAYSLEAPRMMELWNTMGSVGGKGITLGAGPGIRAYHGSPHRFDKFSLDKIGTGEGAQAYGHGLYFAESPGVARSYRDQLARTVSSDDPAIIATAQAQARGGRQAAIDFFEEQFAAERAKPKPDEQWIASYQPALDFLKSDQPLKDSAGALYTTRLNVDSDDLLDWDKPLSQQSEKVRAALEKAGVPPEYKSVRSAMEYLGEQRVKASKGVFSEAEQRSADVAATEALREAGIPGIRYLDQGSRASGEGTRNFVIFDDSLVDIEDIANRANAVRPEAVTDPDFRRLYLQGGAT